MHAAFPLQPRRRISSLNRAVVRGLVQAAVLGAPALTALAQDELPSLRPSTVFLQGGAGEGSNATDIGLTWDGTWRRENAWGRWSAYIDVALGRWRPQRNGAHDGRDEVTRLGITPVLRLHPAGWGDFFVETGIGVNWIFPSYQNGNRQFGTVFNFGSHIGVGWQFGETRHHELALRVQHFSNAGIKEPNPGENFLQLRYAHRF